jgi:hypothetical protein
MERHLDATGAEEERHHHRQKSEHPKHHRQGHVDGIGRPVRETDVGDPPEGKREADRKEKCDHRENDTYRGIGHPGA